MDNELLARIKALTDSLQEFKWSLCKNCKEQKPLNERRLCDACEEKRLQKLAETESTNDKGYVYVYDDSGKIISQARNVVEQSLGRKLQSHEVVLRRDGRKDNNDIGNLILGLKNGTPIRNLRCNHCGTIGDFNLVEEEVSEAPD